MGLMLILCFISLSLCVSAFMETVWVQPCKRATVFNEAFIKSFHFILTSLWWGRERKENVLNDEWGSVLGLKEIGAIHFRRERVEIKYPERLLWDLWWRTSGDGSNLGIGPFKRTALELVSDEQTLCKPFPPNWKGDDLLLRITEVVMNHGLSLPLSPDLFYLFCRLLINFPFSAPRYITRL